MAKYVLGENAAKKFKQLTTAKSKSTNRIAYLGMNGIDNYYATPFQVQWAQSSGEKDTNGKYKGTYIIWLPNGFLKVNNIFKEKVKCKPAENYSTEDSDFGWFDLASMFEEVASPYTEWPEEFSIWLDYSGETVSFHFTDSYASELSRRILIARIINYNVIQIVNSSIVISDANMPFDIIKWNFESELDKPVLRLVRNWFYDANHVFTQLPDVDLTLLSGSIMNVYLVNRLAINDKEAKISSEYHIEFTKDLSSVPELSAPVNKDTRNFLYWKKIYSYSGEDGTILYDYRNAVVEMNWTGIDNNTISYGEDGQYSNFLHLANFYNRNADIGELRLDDDILVRRGNSISSYLGYVPFSNIMNELSNELSDLSIYVDNASISKGADGQLSGVIHMNDFHNKDSNTTTMAYSDIVLRTPHTDNSLSDVVNKLEYMPFDDFSEMIDTWIDSAIEDSLNEGGAIKNALDDLSVVVGGGGSSGMFAWDETTRTIGAGGCMVGRQWYSAQNTGSNKSDGLYSVVVTLNSSGSVFVGVVSNATLGQAPTATQCWIPIYQITDGKIAIDYRGAFVVPVYE